jgi:hypothetical protein
MSPDAPTMADGPLLGDLGQLVQPVLVVNLDTPCAPPVPSDRLLIGVATGPLDKPRRDLASRCAGESVTWHESTLDRERKS